jgi:hypothetical protein
MGPSTFRCVRFRNERGWLNSLAELAKRGFFFPDAGGLAQAFAGGLTQALATCFDHMLSAFCFLLSAFCLLPNAFAGRALSRSASPVLLCFL